jgi:predicted RNA-binding protein YlxR (DUF448 family)
LKVLPTKDKTYCFQQLSKDIKIGHGHFAPTVHVEATENDRGCYYQKSISCCQEKKNRTIIKLITEETGNKFWFSPIPNKANKLTESMISAGIKAAIHGNKGQGVPALAGFKTEP